MTQKPTSAHIFAAEYFAEEVRRELYDRYGEKKLYEGGLSVRTTLDTKLQVLARKTLTDGLVQFRRGARLARAGHQDRHLRRLGRQARRRQGAGRRRALAARGGAGDQRPVGAHRLAAGARAGRRCQQGTRRRHRAARRREMGARSSGKAPTKVSQVLDAGDVVYVEPDQDRRTIPAASGAGSLRRHGGRGSLDRPRARHGRRLLLRPEPVQPRDAGAAPARLLVQADRLRRRARQRLHAVDAGARRADRDRSGARARRLEAGKLRKQFLRPVDAALRHRAFAQRDDGAAGAGRRHAADRRICQALRRLRRPAALSVVRARRRRDHGAAHGHRLLACSTTAAGASSRR